MFLLGQPNGAKYWRFSYRFLGKQKTLALGVDPGEAKKDAKRAAEIAAANSFEAVAREWFDSQRPGWSDGYAEKVLNSLRSTCSRRSALARSRKLIRHRCSASCVRSKRAACAIPIATAR